MNPAARTHFFLLIAFLQFLRAFGFSNADIETSDRLTSLTKSKGSKTVTFLLGDFTYAAMLVNNIAQLRRLGIDDVGIGCTDTELQAFLAARGMHCALFKGEHLHDHLLTLGVFPNMRQHIDNMDWVRMLQYKMYGVALILRAGLDVLYVDADALLLGDPYPAIRSAGIARAGGGGTGATFAPADMLFSSGAFPKHSIATWGMAACAGFFFARSGVSTRHFFNEILVDTVVFRDDQRALNRQLRAAGLAFDGDGGRVNETVFAAGAPAAVAEVFVRKELVRVGFLDPARFVRHCDRYPQGNGAAAALLWHCTSQQSHASLTKAQRFASQGLWFLREDWDDDGYVKEAAATAAAAAAAAGAAAENGNGDAAAAAAATGELWGAWLDAVTLAPVAAGTL
ncbi:unnamed protein product [Phaeothamnion confervicola]